MCVTTVELAVLLLVVASVILNHNSVSAQGDPIQLTGADMQELVDAHNLFRGLVDPPASNMQPVVWNNELASVAQNYSMMCIFDENPNRAAQAPSAFDSVGENLSASSTQNPNYTRFVELAWYNQRDNYDYVTNMCTSPGSCTAYTQLVWAGSTMVGCGVARCETLEGLPLPDAVLIVCNYGPGGNVPGERPYISGEPCSNCPEGLLFCLNNVCSPSIETTELPTTIQPTTISDSDEDDVDEEEEEEERESRETSETGLTTKTGTRRSDSSRRSTKRTSNITRKRTRQTTKRRTTKGKTGTRNRTPCKSKACYTNTSKDKTLKLKTKVKYEPLVILNLQ